MDGEKGEGERGVFAVEVSQQEHIYISTFSVPSNLIVLLGGRSNLYKPIPFSQELHFYFYSMVIPVRYIYLL